MDEVSSNIDIPPHSQEATYSTPPSHPLRNEDVRNEHVPSWSNEPFSLPTNKQPSTAVFSDKDESAVAGLLALGTSMNEPEPGIADFAVSTPKGVAMTSSTPPTHPSNSRIAYSPQPMNSMKPLKSTTDEISPTETQTLLRHYRYEVASWVSLLNYPEYILRADYRADSWIYVI
jgi:hypothetical protein